MQKAEKQSNAWSMCMDSDLSMICYSNSYSNTPKTQTLKSDNSFEVISITDTTLGVYL